MGVSLKKISGAAEEIDYPWKEVEQVRARDEYLREQGRSNVTWIGDARGRGFMGEPTQEDAHLLLNGMAADGERLLPKAVVEGLDLTFSVPKDLSAAHALGDRELRRRLEAVFDRAFERAMEKLERHLLFVRYGNGHNEAEREAAHASGLVGIRYDHLRSRLADPQNHYHAYVSTVVQGPDGQTRRMWIRSMRELRRTLGYWHEAFLREEISNEFPGVQWEAVQENGTARLTGFPDSLRDALSKRSQRIKEEVAAWEKQTGRHANSAVKQKITLETRPPKPDVPDHEQWVAEVAALADAHGYTREVLAQQFLAETAAPVRDIPTPGVVADRLLARDGLTATASFFRDTDVMVGVIQADIPASRVEEYVAAVLADPRAIAIETVKGTKYVTQGQVQTEQMIERVVIDGIDAVPRLAATAQEVQSAIQRIDLELNLGQREVVFAAATSPDRVVLIEAAAGSGKTTSALVISRALQAHGLGVRGVAPTGIAAVQLAADAEIDARTIHSLRWKVESGGSLSEGGRYQVLIMDEAGMADIWQAQWLLSQVEREDMKLIVMGDSNQLISVEPGGWLGYFTRSGLRPALRLTEVVRQSDERHGKAVLDIARGRPGSWIKYQQDHGNIVHLGSGQEHQYGSCAAELLGDAADRHGRSHVVAITPTNMRRELINECVQEARLDRGELGELLAESGEHERFHVGDRLMYVGRNDSRRNLQNGLAGTVVGNTENGDLVIALDDEQTQLRHLGAEHIAQDIRLAYAVTDYKAQARDCQEFCVNAWS
jgi:conjugative relaxase-like TrwC/TraI family protein